MVRSTVQKKCFIDASGGEEVFLVAKPDPALDFAGQLAETEKAYRAELERLELGPETAVFRRVFASDLSNQYTLLAGSPLLDSSAAVSLVQQPPMPAGKVALLAYHVRAEGMEKQRLSPHHLLVRKGALSHLWSADLHSVLETATPGRTVERQTEAVFHDLAGMLGTQGGRLKSNCVRTWIFVKDVDEKYGAMVDSRRDLFTDHGMTEDTHYIASTGIQGWNGRKGSLLSMDAVSILGLKPVQMAHLKDHRMMCDTSRYKVTFERGVCVSFADRKHIYVSGTASIDKEGNVLHEGDILRQTDRTLANFRSILEHGGVRVADLMYLVIYLRDTADAGRVADRLAALCCEVPWVMVLAPVCRPSWLIEIEGVAVAPNNDPSLPAF